MGVDRILLALLLGVLGALAYRARGMNENSVPDILRFRWFRRLLCVAVLGVSAAIAGSIWWGAGLAAIFALPGIIIGHGSYQDLGTVERPDNEWFRKPLDWIFGTEPPYRFWRDFTGLALTGLALTAPIAVLPGVSLWYGIIGIAKPLGYWLGWRLHPRYEATAIGELCWGFSMTTALVLA